MLQALKHYLAPPVPPDVLAQLREDAQVNSAGYDPWGLHVETAERTVRMVRWIYEKYFRVRAYGIDQVPQGRVMLVGNHGGQLPFDGLLVALAMALEAHPPRLVRGMVERWFPSLPFISTLFTRCGQTVGDPRNCEELLRRDQAIMVFPEGVRGSGKTYWHRYQLQGFGTGFVRLALATGSPIVPVAVVGTEETYPSVYDAAWLARLLGTPYVPVTPFLPALGLLGLIPLPVRIDLHFGAPIHFDAGPDATDEEVHAMVDRVKGELQGMIDRGLAQRPVLDLLQRVVPGGRKPPRQRGGALEDRGPPVGLASQARSELEGASSTVTGVAGSTATGVAGSTATGPSGSTVTGPAGSTVTGPAGQGGEGA